MPVVPFTRPPSGGKAKLPPGPPPAEPFALMAAAQMHAEGRLIEPTGDASSGSIPNPK